MLTEPYVQGPLYVLGAALCGAAGPLYVLSPPYVGLYWGPPLYVLGPPLYVLGSALMY